METACINEHSILRKIHWPSVVLGLVILIAALDAALFLDARGEKALTGQIRLIPQGLKSGTLAVMAVYAVFCYRLPSRGPVVLFEGALWLLAALILFNLPRMHQGYQYTCALRSAFWIFTYFFFRLTIHTIDNLNTKFILLSIFVLLLGLRMHIAAVLWTESVHSSEAEDFSSNAAFYLQYVILFLLCCSAMRPRDTFLLMLLAGLIVLTMKRSAILSTGFSLVLLVPALCRMGNRKAAKIIVVCMVLGLIIAIPFVYDQVAARFESLAEDGGSQRDWRYSEAWSRWQEADFVHWLIGYGFYDTSSYLQEIFYSHTRPEDQLPLHAHSDIFQMLPDLGLTGLIQLVLMHGALLWILALGWIQKAPWLGALTAIYCYYLFFSALNGAMAKFETAYLMLALAMVMNQIETPPLTNESNYITNTN